MRFLISLCVPLLLLVNGETTNGQTSVTSSDPCSNYNMLDDYWRDIHQTQSNNLGNDDRLVEWNGWYRLFLNGQSAQMSEVCTTYTGCGGETGLYLSDSHPRIEDGEVTREVVGTIMWSFFMCGADRTHPIQVKACPGDYYVYKFVKPDMSISRPSYCAVAFNSIDNDPCYNYKPLDRPWRASNEAGLYICDGTFSWSGWYRLYHNGMNIRMAENCVNSGACNTQYGLWLNGPHPHIEDGVVTREVCGDSMVECCLYSLIPIRVKACPGGYYVYELPQPHPDYCTGYCTDINTISEVVSPTIPTSINGSITTLMTSSDPCLNYNMLDDYWRDIHQTQSNNLGNDDRLVEWNGWYRLFLNGQSAQMSEVCTTYTGCGGETGLYLSGSHPRIEDGEVTREVVGTIMWSFFMCGADRTHPIQVKACPGDYYVYKFVKPDMSISRPSYCAVAFNSIDNDPCYNYKPLDRPWRASNEAGLYICDGTFSWSGWYRLYHNGMNIRMAENCVNSGACNTQYGLWLNGPHPHIEDGVVTREVCGDSMVECCLYSLIPIRVKACPGGYYVYELPQPHPDYCTGYCTDINTISEVVSPTIPTSINGSITTLKATAATTTTTTTAAATTTTTTAAATTTTTTTTTAAAATTTTTTTATTTTRTTVRDPCFELNCTEDEWCGEQNGVYGCFCNEDHPTSDPGNFDVYEMCENSSGFVSLSRCQVFEAGFPSDLLHLNDPSCKGTVQNGRLKFRFDNNDHICGTSLVANGTHFIYENFITGQPGPSEGVISRERGLKLSFSCIYHQTQTVSMDINPLESRIHRTFQGEGTYQVRMVPYLDAEFSVPFNGSVGVKVNEEVFVEVGVYGVDRDQFASVIERCWATPVNDPLSSLRWDLITEECPNPHDKTAKLLQNGVSTSSRFSSRMFVFTADSKQVYLHCKVHLCLRTNNDCSAHCYPGHHMRERRSVDFHDTSSISMGPLVWSEGNSDIVAPELRRSQASGLCGSMLLLFLNAFILF
ncbi:uncharacterized protein [Paramisgurnus dabryanus]|uniref:uncharacterized protein isoform X2 n=1 Tax=Paramisgurnus dabryanus TaxID=90735 RepID=UPI003CCFDB80